MALRLLQIPFSHNSVKVRVALARKGLDHEVVDVHPLKRREVKRRSGQTLLPVLCDGDRAIADSTAILLHLERAYPDPPLLPTLAVDRAECLVLEEWADAAFMALTRRLAYVELLTHPERLELLFFPKVDERIRGPVTRVSTLELRRRFGLTEAQRRADVELAPRLARVALDRIDGRPFLVGDAVTIADISLASMAGLLAVAPAVVREHSDVAALVAWSEGILGDDAYGAPRDARRRHRARSGAVDGPGLYPGPPDAPSSPISRRSRT